MKAGKMMLAPGVVPIGAAAFLYLAPAAGPSSELLITGAAAEPLAGAGGDLGL